MRKKFFIIASAIAIALSGVTSNSAQAYTFAEIPPEVAQERGIISDDFGFAIYESTRNLVFDGDLDEPVVTEEPVSGGTTEIEYESSEETSIPYNDDVEEIEDDDEEAEPTPTVEPLKIKKINAYIANVHITGKVNMADAKVTVKYNKNTYNTTSKSNGNFSIKIKQTSKLYRDWRVDRNKKVIVTATKDGESTTKTVKTEMPDIKGKYARYGRGESYTDDNIRVIWQSNMCSEGKCYKKVPDNMTYGWYCGMPKLDTTKFRTSRAIKYMKKYYDIAPIIDVPCISNITPKLHKLEPMIFCFGNGTIVGYNDLNLVERSYCIEGNYYVRLSLLPMTTYFSDSLSLKSGAVSKSITGVPLMYDDHILELTTSIISDKVIDVKQLIHKLNIACFEATNKGGIANRQIYTLKLKDENKIDPKSNPFDKGSLTSGRKAPRFYYGIL